MTLAPLVITLLVTTFVGSAPEEASAPTPPSYGDNACVQCHENLPGRLSAIVEEWKHSVHYLNNIACDNCHGGDANVRRDQFDSEDKFKKRSHLERDSGIFTLHRSGQRFTSTVRGRSVSYFCGKCHARIKEKHLGSPHGGLGNPTCLFCHGETGHAIQDPRPDIMDARPQSEGGRCATCHRAATMEVVANIKKILVKADTQLAAGIEQYNWLEAQGYKNLALQDIHQHNRETLSQLRQTFHGFDMREINSFALAITDNAERTKQTYDLIVGLRRTKARQAMVGLCVTAFLLAFAALLLYYRRALPEHRPPATPPNE